jgi:DNA-binding transcriptional regulator LsrR (DeoR family)
MDEWGRLTAAVVGLGTADVDAEVRMLFADYLDEGTQGRLRSAGAAGDICMRFYDGDGQPIADGLRGIVGVELEQLRQAPKVIAVAGGADKARSILGALRGGYVDVLITDEAAARRILALSAGEA